MNDLFIKIIENKEIFIPNIISNRQYEVIEKIIKKQKLTKTENNYLYNGIKRKIKALSLINISNKIYLYEPFKFIKIRIEKANEILNKEKNAFISGSFLFSEKYNDIDIFILSKTYKEKKIDNFHYIYIKEKDLRKPIFFSASKSCISNFIFPSHKIEIKKIRLDKIISMYQEAIVSILEKDELKICKDLIFEYNLYNENKTLSSFELFEEYQKFLNNNFKIQFISKIFMEIIKKNFNKYYIIKKMSMFIEDLNQDIGNITPNDHLKIYKKTYSQIINEI